MTTITVYAVLVFLTVAGVFSVGIVGYAVITFAAIVFDYFTPRR